jgi:hypothetical protein
MTIQQVIKSGFGCNIRPQTKVMTRYTPESGSGLQDT